MNRLLALTLSLLLVLAASPPAVAGCGNCPGDSKNAKSDDACGACPVSGDKAGKGGEAKAAPAHEHKFPTVDVAAIQELLDKKEPVVILDARSGKWDDGRRLPGAVALAPDAKPEEIAKLLPDKKAKIITYCSGLTCPASAKLAEALHKAGYENIHEFPEGVEGWEKAGKKFIKKQ